MMGACNEKRDLCIDKTKGKLITVPGIFRKDSFQNTINEGV